ncbi:MBL fold metallo-hydrolase [Segetibacter koreensis]|uniref:MBL fold metallo-hydrolase n=1 Tax=Segetibacter koreensis TaxID=398037 RepID=UPI00038249CA|nr:3',5'-cyclic-nucleotide phosphodiesterase [Segetibacter koreensis]
MNNFFRYFLLSFICFSFNTYAQPSIAPTFKIIPLGVNGGLDESNLSSYMVAPVGSNSYICLDAGTLHFGIEKAVKAKIFNSSTSNVLRNYIKGYLISHAHLDHISGLIINSPEDTVKNIYGLPYCLDILKDKYFTWRSWANFANEGDKPTLKKYYYTYLSHDKETSIQNTEMYVKAFPLSHSKPYQSTAFLIRYDSAYLLYLGDTGADEVEKTNNLHLLWQQVAPLVKTKKLKGIFIEASFPDQQPQNQLFGHLTPRLLMNEMQNLAKITGKAAMKNVAVLITHIKPSGDSERQIKSQLFELNTLQVHLIFPNQGEVLQL